jgi:2-polyprenyl-3-methyl-5-hydroxy-6-metoxy-1,4-benzoquinol methylase
MEPERSR